MLVIAKKDNIQDFPEDLKGDAFNQVAGGDGSVSLTLGKKYVVSGVAQTPSHTFYLVLYDDGELNSYPWWYPSECFDVLDATIPSDWVTAKPNGDSSIMTFPELATDPDGSFYDALDDGEPSAVKTFLGYYENYARYHGIWYVDGKPSKA